MTARLRCWWRRASRRRKAATIAGSTLALVVAYVGQGILSVVGQVDDYAEYWRERAEEPGEIVYWALGDSAAQGVGASDPWRGYVGQLITRIEDASGRSVRIINISVSGARVADLVADQLPQLPGLPEPDLVTLAIGGNDAGNTDPEDFRRAFSIAVAALPDGAIVADLPDFQGGPRLQASRELSDVARQVIAAAEPRITFAPLERSTAANTLLDYSPDFFHPDASGYERWADAFWPAVRERLGMR